MTLARSVLLLLALTACLGGAPRPPEAPSRPVGVPAAAVWHGGIDGGEFFLFERAPTKGTYRARVFHDFTGDLLFDGTVRSLADLTTSPGPFAFSGDDDLTVGEAQRLEVVARQGPTGR